MYKAAICICTYKRDELLLKLMDSIFNQKIDRNIIYDIYIVDNYGQSDIKDMISQMNRNNIYYFIEKKRGISNARNRCIEEVKKQAYEYCIFVDDDEVVEENWLSAILNCAVNYNCNIVVGSLITVYPECTENWIIKSKFFLHNRYETGTVLTSFPTNNTLINMNLILEDKIYFDEQYGLTGGEDTKLSKTLILKGEKVIHCDEAIAYDVVDLKRLNMKYMLKRKYIVSLVHVKIEKELYNKVQVIIKRVVSALVAILIGILIIPTVIIKGKVAIFQAMDYIAKGLGQVSGMIGYTKNLY